MSAVEAFATRAAGHCGDASRVAKTSIDGSRALWASGTDVIEEDLATARHRILDLVHFVVKVDAAELAMLEAGTPHATLVHIYIYIYTYIDVCIHVA